MNRLNASLAGAAASLAALGAGPATQPAHPRPTYQEPPVHVRVPQDLKVTFENLDRLKLRGGMPMAPGSSVDPQIRIAPRYVTPRQDWVARRFNGMTYYLIPCAPSAAQAAVSAPPTTRPAP